ncbi:bifunctional diguanylate cyclase/phosphodiesterase [Aquibacillus rhizosphaerae]|uniref:EAL domain-containing protein n=1 Tax=Aquibacillus rhizosphaerae TaxID=3051431 RepID=A0ABT7L4S8_9BACI|nr:bifunctional diguanylate cyclase/phosphodiesterase [Aquibacillus sp. LR5S19]MDL4840187.1 EAL domain-containing protein [Aquibacillus sp. LR5S19]
MNNQTRLKAYLKSNRFSYDKFIEIHSDAIYILDEHGVLIDYNQGLIELTGYYSEELMGKSYQSMLYPEDISKVGSFFNEAMDGKGKRRNFRIVHKSGEVKTVSIDAVPIKVDGDILGLFVIGKDITGWLEEIKQQNNKFQSLIKNSSDIISIINKNGEIVYFSDSLETVLGFKVEEMTGDLYQIMHPDDMDRARLALQEVLSKRPDQTVKIELRLKHKNGNWLDIQVIATNLVDDPDVKGIVINYRDITDLKSAQNEIQYIAYHDYLTGLPNRRFFEKSLEDQLILSKEEQTKLAVLFVDLDNFKSINDTLGHDSGDILLKTVAQTLERSVPKKAMVSRWGGDEFFIMIPNIAEVTEISEVANQIKHNLNDTFTHNQYEFVITGSIGISVFPESGQDKQSLLKTADLAMYLTKEQGKNDFQIFTQEMMEKANETFSLQRDLNRALVNNEFELYYQPKISAKDGQICGAEALIRWNHPNLGMIPPNDFIHLAEESGMIVPIGDWVYQEACRQLRRWKEAGKEQIKISVNFSTLQFLQKDLVKRVASFLEENDIEGKWIEIEITESILVHSDQELLNKVIELKKIGIQIALDDFGKGYSSLDYLRKYGFNTIKLDRSFISDIDTNEESAAIASFMIALGKKLNINIVAEGVERKEQLAVLKKLECDELQGYLFSKPVRIAEFEKLWM